MTIDPKLAEAIALARQLPADVPPIEHREQLRTSILALANTHVAAVPRSRGRLVIAAISVAAAAIAIYVVARPPRTAPTIEAHDHGNVHARTGTQFARTSRSPDEIVRLHEGTIDIDVEPLGPRDRFRVIVGASEVEVRGTSFSVTATDDELVAVQVAHGRVEVRPAGGAMTVLEAGQSWRARLAVAAPTAPPIALAAPTAPSLAVAAPAAPPIAVGAHATPPIAIAVAIPKPVTTTTKPRIQPPAIIAAPAPPVAPVAPAVVRAPQDLAYDDGWTAIRSSKFKEASAAFARTLALAPEGPLSDDARFWHAVALAREPRVAEAIAAFRELIEEHPGSAHAGEASAMLGWFLVETKQLDEASKRFHAAETDPSDKVRASARAGLAALAR